MPHRIATKIESTTQQHSRPVDRVQSIRSNPLDMNLDGLEGPPPVATSADGGPAATASHGSAQKKDPGQAYANLYIVCELTVHNPALRLPIFGSRMRTL